MGTAAEHARRRIGDALYEVMMRQTGPARASFILHQMPRHTGIAATAARETLDLDLRFAEEDGRYDIGIRREIPDLSFNAAVDRLTEDLGYPAEITLVAQFFAGTTGRSSDYYRELIERLLAREDAFFDVAGRLVPASLLLVTEDEDEDDVLFFTGLDQNEELNLYRPFLADDVLRSSTPEDTALNIVKAAGDPISNQVLDFFVFRLHKEEFDAPGLLAAMLEDERFYAEPGLRWGPGDIRPQIAEELQKINRVSKGSSAAPEMALDLETVLNEPLPYDHPGYFIEDNDLTMIYEIVNSSVEPVSIDELLFNVLELYPDDADFVPAAHSIYGLLHDDPTIMDVTLNTFKGRAALPAWISDVPAMLVPMPAEGDVVLELAGLDEGMPAKVQDPYLEDYMDDDVSVTEDLITVDETFYTVPYHHAAAGTMKLRKMDQRFFGIPRSAAPVKFVDGDDGEWDAWVNADTGLVVGLKDMYEALGVQAGHLIGISRSEEGLVFAVENAGEDDSTGITEERLADLTKARKKAEAGSWSLFQALCEVMRAYREGIAFETLHAQVNVVKRATRLQVASLLSYHLCFRSQDGAGEEWIFAPRAVNAGVVQTKRRYIIEDWGVAQ